MPLRFIPPGGGEVIGDSSERRVEILCDAEALNATWSRFGPGRDGADLHVHRRHSDLFYVLEGELTLRVGLDDEQVAVGPGTLVRVPPLVAHGFRNAGARQMRYLNLHAPGMRFADYLRGLRDGRPFAYDQEDPPGEGVQDPTTVVIGPPDAHPAGSPVDVAELRCEAGASADVATDGARLVALYVLEGELILDATGEGLHAPAGTWIELEPGGEQRVAAGPGVDTRFLQVRAPA